MCDILVIGSIFSGHPILTSGIHKEQLTCAHLLPLLQQGEAVTRSRYTGAGYKALQINRAHSSTLARITQSTPVNFLTKEPHRSILTVRHILTRCLQLQPVRDDL